MENVYDNVIDLSNKLNLEEQINIISYLDIMISMDSANADILQPTMMYLF